MVSLSLLERGKFGLLEFPNSETVLFLVLRWPREVFFLGGGVRVKDVHHVQPECDETTMYDLSPRSKMIDLTLPLEMCWTEPLTGTLKSDNIDVYRL